MKITLIEPFFTGSHAAWAESYQHHSAHEIQILSLPGRFWKWRMHGAAITLARELLAQEQKPDLILATDMLDLSSFQALSKKETARLPHVIYFHENQITYPWSPNDRDPGRGRDQHYGFINIISALSADQVIFNSDFHRQSFLKGALKQLKTYPDYQETEVVGLIRNKSRVLALGLELESFQEEQLVVRKSPPLILWNHRWDHDKNPAGFFLALERIVEKGINFRLAVIGEETDLPNNDFGRAKEKFAQQIIHWGYIKDRKEYAKVLKQADLLPVTSNQEFFGISVLEAVATGCIPIAPDRLSYPEILPKNLHHLCLYSSFNELVEKLSQMLTSYPERYRQQLKDYARRYCWKRIAAEYDKNFSKLTQVSSNEYC